MELVDANVVQMTARTAFTWLARGRSAPLSCGFCDTNTSSDGNIRYYEYENDEFKYLTEYKSLEPQRGIAFLPRRGVNVCPPPPQ